MVNCYGICYDTDMYLRVNMNLYRNVLGDIGHWTQTILKNNFLSFACNNAFVYVSVFYTKARVNHLFFEVFFLF